MPTTALIFWLFLYLLRSPNRFPENRYFHQRWRKIQFSPCNISQDQPYWWNHGDVLWDFIHIFIYNLNSSHQLTQIRLIKYLTILYFQKLYIILPFGPDSVTTYPRTFRFGSCDNQEWANRAREAASFLFFRTNSKIVSISSSFLALIVTSLWLVAVLIIS